MGQQVLFSQKFVLSHWAHQSHIVYRFFVPNSVQKLIINFHYSPLLETDKESMRRSLDKEMLYNESEYESDGFRNLLTLSINDSSQFRGAHHYFGTDQCIIISETETSLGFVSGEVMSGTWELILSNHGIFSDEVHGSIEIIAEGDINNFNRSCSLERIHSNDYIAKDRTRDFELELYDYRTELHSHTNHSDAEQTTEELIIDAVKEEIDWLAITDHNTISAIYECLNSKKFNQSIGIISGMEFTTFYGHFLIYGDLNTIQNDWTQVNLNNINQYFKNLKSLNICVTLAHPYDQGNPYCTGCRFDYPLDNYKFIDNIEVWNYINPNKSESNTKAYQLWTKLLSRRMEINAVAGRDWHKSLNVGEVPAITHVLAPKEAGQSEILKAISLGRTYISLEPTLQILINQKFTIGDRISASLGKVHININLTFNEENDYILRMYDEDKIIWTEKIKNTDNYSDELILDISDKFLIRFEVLNLQEEIILFTNPIYISIN